MLTAQSLSEAINQRMQVEAGQAQMRGWIDQTYGHPTGDVSLTDRLEPMNDAEDMARSLSALNRDPGGTNSAVSGRKRRRSAPYIWFTVAVAMFAVVQTRSDAIRSALLAQRADVVEVAKPSGPVGEVTKVSEPATEVADAATSGISVVSSTAVPAQLDAQQAKAKAGEDARIARDAAAKEQAAKAQAVLEQAALEAAKEQAEKAQAIKDEQAKKATRIEPAADTSKGPPAAPRQPATPPAPPTVVASVATSAPAGSRSLAAPTAQSDIDTGKALLAKGNLAAARQSFEKAARSGQAEGALALGNTYDPSSLARLGLNDKGDPVLARQWYRRAHEIALNQP